MERNKYLIKNLSLCRHKKPAYHKLLFIQEKATTTIIIIITIFNNNNKVKSDNEKFVISIVTKVTLGMQKMLMSQKY